MSPLVSWRVDMDKKYFEGLSRQKQNYIKENGLSRYVNIFDELEKENPKEERRFSRDLRDYSISTCATIEDFLKKVRKLLPEEAFNISLETEYDYENTCSCINGSTLERIVNIPNHAYYQFSKEIANEKRAKTLKDKRKKKYLELKGEFGDV